MELTPPPANTISSSASPNRRSAGRSLLLSNGFDAFGTQVSDFAYSLIAITTLGMSAGENGILNALFSMSFLLLAVPLSNVVDRYGPGRVLPFTLGAKFILAASAAILASLGYLSIPVIMVVMTVLGIITVATENAQSAIVPLVTASKDRIVHLSTSMASVDKIATICTPLLAAFLVAHLGTTGTLVSTALLGLLAVSAGLRAFGVARAAHAEANQICHAEAAQPKQSEPEQAQLREATQASKPQPENLKKRDETGFWAGFKVLLNQPLLLAITVSVAFSNIGLAIGDTVLAIFILQDLDVGKEMYGLLGTIAAGASLAAAAVSPWVSKKFALCPTVLTGYIFLTFAAILPLAAYFWRVGHLPLLLLFEIIWAVASTIANIAS